MTVNTTFAAAGPRASAPRGPAWLFVLGPALSIAGVGAAAAGWLYSRTGSFAGAYPAWHQLYYYFLPILLLAWLPALLKDLRARGLDLGEEIRGQRGWLADSAIGLGAGVLSLVAVVIYIRLTGLQAPPLQEQAPLWLRLLVLGVIAPPIKEIAFRLYPLRVLAPGVGPFTAFVVGTTAFALLDWQNLGASFVAGAIWYGAYQWRGSLRVPIIAHMVANVLSVVLS